MTKIVYIGSVKFSEYCLEVLLNMEGDFEIVGIVTSNKNRNDDFCQLTYEDIPTYVTYSLNIDNCYWFIKSLKPDFIFCFGWSEIIKKRILDICPVLGYHPTLLPIGRGRHPIIWTIVKRVRASGSTFFFMDEGVDSGDILSQVRFGVSHLETAKRLYLYLESIAEMQLHDFMPKLIDGSYTTAPQDHSKATYYRKRERGKDEWIEYL